MRNTKVFLMLAMFMFANPAIFAESPNYQTAEQDLKTVIFKLEKVDRKIITLEKEIGQLLKRKKPDLIGQLIKNVGKIGKSYSKLVVLYRQRDILQNRFNKIIPPIEKNTPVIKYQYWPYLCGPSENKGQIGYWGNMTPTKKVNDRVSKITLTNPTGQ